MPKRTSSYDDALLADLRNPEEAAAYLAASLEDTSDPDAEKLFLMALQNVARAYGMQEVAEKTSLGRESLYKALSKQGNPKLRTLTAVLESVGLRLSVSPIGEASLNEEPLNRWKRTIQSKWSTHAEVAVVRGKVPNRGRECSVASIRATWSSKDEQTEDFLLAS